LIVFGANAIENTPIVDAGSSPHFPVTPAVMNHALSQICEDYDIEYWAWIPANFDLTNPTLRAQSLAQHEAFYQNCVRLDAVFVPGGDPGDNPPDLVMDFLEDVAALLATYHPSAGVWVSNQGFEHAENDWFFDYLQTQHPTWLRGVVFGPWTKLTLAEERARTPLQYPIRHYPDITHNVRCQYAVPEWDPAFANTLGREASNPRPVGTAHIHNFLAPYTNGFLAYSEGVHDDVNKYVWCLSGWDPDTDVDDILTDYGRFFLGPNVAQDAASGILQLEDNWDGPLAGNAVVPATWSYWTALESANPGLASNWRWQLCLLRAYYDYYIQERLAYETNLEDQVMVILEDAVNRGANTAMNDAEAVLAQAVSSPVRADLRSRIVSLCADLFSSIGMQTSTSSPYLASGLERGCVLDLVDWAVNDRWWLEYRFDQIRLLGTEGAKLAALDEILEWENPGPGGFYDNLGTVGQQPHLVQQLPWEDDPGRVESTQNENAWHNGNSTSVTAGAARLSWQNQAETLFNHPLEMRYTGLAPDANYTVRIVYDGRFAPSMYLTADGIHTVHGTLAQPSPPQKLEYDLPRYLTYDGTLDLRWDLVTQRGCQVAEVWLLRSDPTVRFVDKDAVGAGNGTSWANAFTTIQAAINASSSGDTLWIAEGSYAESLTLANGVQLFGGFSGVETLFAQRDIEAHAVIIDARTAAGGSPADHGVILQGVDSTVLDGLTIMGANANGTAPHNSGGGILCDDADSTNIIARCTIVANTATGFGGGIYCGNASSPVIFDCRIAGNSSTDDGGGLYCTGGSNPAVSRCTISGNQSGDYGGGVACYSSSAAVFANCIISGNSAPRAGAMRISSSNVKLVNCTLSANAATVQIGGVSCTNASPEFIDTIFESHANLAIHEGSSDADPSVQGCLFNNNTGGDYYNDDTASTLTGATAINALSQADGNVEGAPQFFELPSGVWASVTFNATTNRTSLVAAQPAFATYNFAGFLLNPDTSQRSHALIVSNTSNTLEVAGNVTSSAATGEAFEVLDFHLTSTSGAINAGTETGAAFIDVDGESRPAGTGVDIGIDEFVDSDGDTLADIVESNSGDYLNLLDTGSDPNDPDTDNDQLSDGYEVTTSGTDPTDADTDDDTYEDGYELSHGSNPLDQNSTPPVGLGVLSVPVFK
ncbi:MAG: right-handed parallel beta-helix repeat-containing protein, partial [Candidatus Hydrogenedentes bacterium]|nr:right-handed parallel beta-helix repeat-containing protein [Candidatus Hydrogenedentota bacterium]